MDGKSLFEIDKRLESVFIIPETGEGIDEETGEILDKEYIDSLEMAFDEKVKNILLWIKQLDSEVEMAKKQEAMVKAWKKSKENRRDSLKKYVAGVLNGRKWEADDMSCKAGWRITKDSVTVDDVKAIPIEYFKTPQYESNLNKTAIKEALKAGTVIAGVHLEDKNNIQIK